MPFAESAGLNAHVVAQRGSFVLDAEISTPPGTVGAVIGPNGAGKSTLIGAIAGLVELSGGRVTLDGRVLSEFERALSVAVGARDVAVCFQDGLLFEGLSVIDNVAFGLRARGESRRVSRAAVTHLLARMELSDRAHEHVAHLSGGLAARVSLARALAVQPKLLLLDEPFASLDAIAAADYRAWLADLLRETSTTTLVVTHDPRDVASLAQHVYVLEAGRVTDERATADLASSPSPFVQRFLSTPDSRIHTNSVEPERASGSPEEKPSNSTIRTRRCV